MYKLISDSLELAQGTYIYEYSDFADSSDKVYGGSSAYKIHSTGIWVMMAGDANANGQVDNLDKNDIWFLENGSFGYLNSDFDMNGQVDETDKNSFWTPNTDKSSQVPD